MPLFLPDTMDAEAFKEMQHYDLTRWVCFRQVQGWVIHSIVREDPNRPNLWHWEMDLETAAGKVRKFRGEFFFDGPVHRPPPPVYRTRFRRKAVI